MAAHRIDPTYVSGAWRVGDPVGRRRFVDVGRVRGVPVTVAYETYGRLTPARDNAVLIQHAFTSDSHVAGAAEPGHPTSGWWGDFVGPGSVVDTDTSFVICPNVFGGCQGTTGPASDHPDGGRWGSRFPEITAADQAEVERRLIDALGITRLAGAIGLSMGGHRTLEWMRLYPDALASALLVACSARSTALQIASRSAQIEAITADPKWRGGDYYDAAGPAGGLALARRIAFLSYRSEVGLDDKFPDTVSGGRGYVGSWLDHQAATLLPRFDAGTYVTLTRAMSSYNRGLTRARIDELLGGFDVPTTVIGFSSDPLYPIRLQREIADALPNCVPARIADSPHGHDGFFIEREVMFDAVRTALARG